MARRGDACALACYEVAAEIGVANSDGPGTFKEKFYDAIYHLNAETVDKMSKIAIMD